MTENEQAVRERLKGSIAHPDVVREALALLDAKDAEIRELRGDIALSRQLEAGLTANRANRPADDGLVAGNAELRIGLMQARYMLRSESAKQDDPNYAAALCRGAEFCEQAATALRAQSDAHGP